MQRRKFLRKIALGAGGILCASYPMLIERHWVQLNHYTVPIPNLPKSFHGFRIAHLTDLHLGLLVSLSYLRRVIRKTMQLKPDMIVCTGDYIHERKSTQQINTIWPLLSTLQAPYGVYSVLGNHDHWGDFDRSLYWLQKSGQNVRHQSRVIKKRKDRIRIAGAGDLWEDEIGIDHALQSVPEEEIRIVLAHNPDTMDGGFKSRVDLMITGHTHGGQVNLPLLGRRVLPVNNKAYGHGLVQTSRGKVFISSGIGWAVAPIRLNCPPEIAVLVLKQMEKDVIF